MGGLGNLPAVNSNGLDWCFPKIFSLPSQKFMSLKGFAYFINIKCLLVSKISLYIFFRVGLQYL